MYGAVSARCRRSAATNSGYRFFFEIFVCVVISGEARHDCFSQYNADADGAAVLLGNATADS